MSASLLEPRHAFDVLEAAARETDGVSTWVDGITHALGRALPSPLGGSAVLAERIGNSARVLHTTTGVGLTQEQAEAATGQVAKADAFDPFYFHNQHVDTMSTVLLGVSAHLRSVAHEFLTGIHAADIIGLSARSGRGHSLVVSSIRATPTRLAMRERLLLGRLALHMETGLRLRMNPGSVVAVLRPDGALLHASGEAREPLVRVRLSAQTMRIERGKLRSQRQLPESTDTWTALVGGQYGFVERTAVQREYLVIEHDPGARATRQLTAAQARAVELSSRGMSGKLVAYALGVSDGEVSRLLAQAAAKAGFATRNELISVAARLKSRPDGATHGQFALTESERQILMQLRVGLSNREIAAVHGTSSRTIANQVAAILRKTRMPSRRALATLML